MLPPPATGASEHARTHTSSTCSGCMKPSMILADSTTMPFDVEELYEYAVDQELFGCVFILVENILPGHSSLTSSTPQPQTTTHENSNSTHFMNICLSAIATTL